VDDFERLDPDEHFEKNSSISNKSDEAKINNEASMIYDINKTIANETFSSCETNSEMTENSTALKMLIKNESQNDASSNYIYRILLRYIKNNFDKIEYVTKVAENFIQSILSEIADIKENNNKMSENVEVLGEDISSLYNIYSEQNIKIDNLDAKVTSLQEMMAKVLVNQNIMMTHMKINEKQIPPENEKKVHSKKTK
jgi:predicted DNA-binding protein (UPF0278 family)